MGLLADPKFEDIYSKEIITRMDASIEKDGDEVAFTVWFLVFDRDEFIQEINELRRIKRLNELVHSEDLQSTLDDFRARFERSEDAKQTMAEEVKNKYSDARFMMIGLDSDEKPRLPVMSGCLAVHDFKDLILWKEGREVGLQYINSTDECVLILVRK